MKILSIDVGIRNLAICILDVNKENMDVKIINWKVINLCEEEKQLCNYKTNNKECKIHAKFIKNDKFYCKRHLSK